MLLFSNYRFYPLISRCIYYRCADVFTKVNVLLTKAYTIADVLEKHKWDGIKTLKPGVGTAGSGARRGQNISWVRGAGWEAMAGVCPFPWGCALVITPLCLLHPTKKKMYITLIFHSIRRTLWEFLTMRIGFYSERIRINGISDSSLPTVCLTFKKSKKSIKV